MRPWIFVLISVATTATSFGQTLTSRLSTVNASFVYGAGADSNSGTPNSSEAFLNSSDEIALVNSGSTSGVLPGGTPYAAGMSYNLQHSYTVSGPLTEFTQLRAIGSTSLETSASGAGVSQLLATNPGNELRHFFTLTRPRNYDFTGTVSSPGYNNPGEVRLQRFDGITWQYVTTTLFLPQSQGTVMSSGTLLPGQYRVISSAAINISGNTLRASTFLMELNFVPNNVTVQGTVSLGDFVGPIAGEVVTFEIRSFNGTLLDTIPNVVLGPGGTYSFTTASTGNFRNLCARGRTWLQNSVPNVVLTSNQTTTVNIALQNGDADQSGEVDAADIDQVINDFGQTTGGGPYNPNSDLDGSTEVDAADIDIAIANFGATNDF